MLMMCYFAEPPVGLYHYKCQLEGCYILIYIIKMEVWKGLVSCGTVVYIIKKPSMHQIKRYNIWQAYMTCTSWDWRRSPLPGRTTRCFNTPTPNEHAEPPPSRTMSWWSGLRRKPVNGRSEKGEIQRSRTFLHRKSEWTHELLQRQPLTYAIELGEDMVAENQRL